MTAGRGRPFWWGAGVALAVLIVLVGWFTAIGPRLSAATTARDDAEALAVQNQALRGSVVALEQVEPGPLRVDLQDAVAGLPYESGLPALTRQLTEQAVRNGVTLDSIVIGSTTPVAPGADPSAAPAEGLLAIPVTLTSTGPGADQRAFLRAIQAEGPRRALVTATQLTPVGEGASVSGRSTLTTTLTTFVAPLAGADQTRLDELLSGTGSS